MVTKWFSDRMIRVHRLRLSIPPQMTGGQHSHGYTVPRKYESVHPYGATKNNRRDFLRPLAACTTRPVRPIVCDTILTAITYDTAFMHGI